MDEDDIAITKSYTFRCPKCGGVHLYRKNTPNTCHPVTDITLGIDGYGWPVAADAGFWTLVAHETESDNEFLCKDCDANWEDILDIFNEGGLVEE